MSDLYIAPHAEWLRPYIDLEARMIGLVHSTRAELADQIRNEGLNLEAARQHREHSEGDVDAIYCALATPERPNTFFGALLERSVHVRFRYSIDQVSIRLFPLFNKNGSLPKEGYPLVEYLASEPQELQRLLSQLNINVNDSILKALTLSYADLWEFLIFKDIPRDTKMSIDDIQA